MSDAPIRLRAQYQRRHNNALIRYVFTLFSLTGHISTSRRNGKTNCVYEVSLHSQSLIRPKLPEHEDICIRVATPKHKPRPSSLLNFSSVVNDTGPASSITHCSPWDESFSVDQELARLFRCSKAYSMILEVLKGVTATIIVFWDVMTCILYQNTRHHIPQHYSLLCSQKTITGPYPLPDT
jgi:hypothetical protein